MIESVPIGRQVNQDCHGTCHDKNSVEMEDLLWGSAYNGGVKGANFGPSQLESWKVATL